MPGYWDSVETELREQFLGHLQVLLSLVSDAHDFIANIAQHPEVVQAEASESLFAARLTRTAVGLIAIGRLSSSNVVDSLWRCNALTDRARILTPDFPTDPQHESAG